MGLEFRLVLLRSTNDDISKNQSYILKVLDSIIQNIFDEKNKSINNILEAIYLKQELIIYLLKTLDDGHFEKEINDFTTTYLGDNLRTIS